VILDTNVGLGRFSAGDGKDFSAPSILLAHMERLGIDRALVYSILAREVDVVTGNEQLMGEVKGHSELIPSWVLVPDARILPGLLDGMRKHQVQVARVFPRAGHFSVRPWCLGPMAERLQRNGNKALFVDFECQHWSEDAVDWEGVSQLCGACPELAVALVGATATAPRNYDRLLAEHPNLYIEISQLICPDEIKRLVERGHGRRLLFGSEMPRRFPGGVLSMIQYEVLGEPERSGILGNNLLRLLGEAHTETDASKESPKRPSEVIDMHVHHGMWHPAASAPGTAAASVRDMDRCGIRRAVVTSLWACRGAVRQGNQAVAEARAQYPDRLFGYLTLDPKHPEELASEIKQHGLNPAFRGLKFHCEWHAARVDDPRYGPALDYAGERRWPVLVHEDTNPDVWDDMCGRYPRVNFLVAHAGTGMRDDESCLLLSDLCRTRDNLYLDLAGSRMLYGFLECLVGRAGAEHVVYGSDYPLFDFGYEIGRVCLSDLSVEQKDLILRRNAEHLLGLNRVQP